MLSIKLARPHDLEGLAAIDVRSRAIQDISLIDEPKHFIVVHRKIIGNGSFALAFRASLNHVCTCQRHEWRTTAQARVETLVMIEYHLLDTEGILVVLHSTIERLSALQFQPQFRMRAFTTCPTFMAFRSVYVCPVPMNTIG